MASFPARTRSAYGGTRGSDTKFKRLRNLSRNVLALLGLDQAVPDHTTLSQRGWASGGR